MHTKSWQEDAHETKRKLSRSEQELAAALQQLLAAKREADTANVVAAEQPQSPTDTDLSMSASDHHATHPA